MYELISSSVIGYSAETKICNERDHMHKDPHVDILRFTLGRHRLVVESERGSLIYRVFVDGELVREQISGAQLDAYLQGMRL